MKKRKAAKALGLVMAAVMALETTGCGSSGTAREGSQTPQTTSGSGAGASAGAEASAGGTGDQKAWTDDDSAVITILMDGANTPDERNIVIEELEKQTGTKINMVYVPQGDYDTKLNTMIAADNAPDIFWCKDLSSAEDYKAAGIIANVEDVLKEFAPNVMEETKDVLYKCTANRDGVYMVPNTCMAWGVNVCIREDWLENLGLEMPDDLESFAQAMHAFTYDDPDGNGKDDTIGYSFSLSTMVGTGRTGQNLFGAFGIAKGHTMVMEDGTVTTWAKHPRFLDAVKYVKRLVDDGVCEPDYISIPNINMFEKIWNGTSGCIEWECMGPTNNWMAGRYVEDPLPRFGFAVLKGPEGDYGTSACYTEYSKGWVFSAKSKNLEGCARIANYCMSEEGSDLMILGVEDVMYKWIDKEAGTIEYLDQYKDSATHRAAGGYCYDRLFKPLYNAEVRTANVQTREGAELAWSVGVDWADILTASQVYIDCGADMDQVINEMFAELLSTDEDKMQEVYDRYMKEWEDVGGSSWEEEVTRLWNEQQAS